MFAIGTSQSLSLVFINREDLETVVKHLQAYADEHSEPDNAIRVYTISDNRIPVEETRGLVRFLKEKFTYTSDGSEKVDEG